MNKKTFLHQAENAFNTLIDLFTELNWEFLTDRENLSVSCVLTGKDFPVPITVTCDKKRGVVSVYSKLSFTIDAHIKDKIAVAVCMINGVLSDGCFDFDYNLGKILFRTGLVYNDSVVSREALLQIISATLNTVDEFNDKLFTLSKGLLDLSALEEYLNCGV